MFANMTLYNIYAQFDRAIRSLDTIQLLGASRRDKSIAAVTMQNGQDLQMKP